jgi:hypothetical protein
VSAVCLRQNIARQHRKLWFMSVLELVTSRFPDNNGYILPLELFKKCAITVVVMICASFGNVFFVLARYNGFLRMSHQPSGNVGKSRFRARGCSVCPGRSRTNTKFVRRG